MNDELHISRQSAMRSAVQVGELSEDEKHELFSLAAEIHQWQSQDILESGHFDALRSAMYKSRHGFDYWLAKIEDDAAAPGERGAITPGVAKEMTKNRVDREE